MTKEAKQKHATAELEQRAGSRHREVRRQRGGQDTPRSPDQQDQNPTLSEMRRPIHPPRIPLTVQRAGRIYSAHDQLLEFELHSESVRWAAAEGVSETVIAAVLLLHERSVDEIASKLRCSAQSPGTRRRCRRPSDNRGAHQCVGTSAEPGAPQAECSGEDPG